MIRAVLLAAIASLATSTVNAATYDYWTALSPGGATETDTGIKERVLVMVGNNGAAGSNAGPPFAVTLTVTTDRGAPICSATLVRQPAILKGQQLIALAFNLSYPKQLTAAEARVTYIANAEIRTAITAADANAANDSQRKTFAFRAGARTSCETLLSR